MTPLGAKTAKRLAVVAIMGAVTVCALLAVEILAVAQGGQSSISELMWMIWSEQPWVILIVSHMFMAPTAFLFGHWFAQSKSVYDAIRKGGK